MPYVGVDLNNRFDKRACAFSLKGYCSIFYFTQQIQIISCARFDWSNEINAHAHYINVSYTRRFGVKLHYCIL